MCGAMYIIPCFTCIGNTGISVAFWASYPHTLSLSHQIITVALYVHSSESHNLQTKYGELTCA